MPRGTTGQASRHSFAASKVQRNEGLEHPQDEAVRARVGSTSKSFRLSEESLKRHDARAYPENNSYVQEMIREEQNQNFRRALYDFQFPNQSGNGLISEAPAAPDPTIRLHPSIEENMGLHRRPVESTALPIRRYATLSGTGDPHPFYAKLEMTDMGVEFGDMETAEKRSNAAEESIKHIQGVKRTNSATTGRISRPIAKRRRARDEKTSDKTGERVERILDS